ncbi:MAG: diaminopimelate dehydrogenase [Eubacteriales bacterium]|nr:diaminopimelate dehydrogenase [Eubacteriales bacterium]
MKAAIIGYGNLGRGVEKALARQNDMTGIGIFTRRDPETVQSAGLPVYATDRLDEFDIDVCILCGGSATDLMTQTPDIVRRFNVVDSFDTHARIGEHFAAVDAAAKAGDKLGMISTGWDPGLFSLQRLIAQSVLPNGETHTFWGKGVSQGHSDALRRIDGVADAIQYTVPKEAAMAAVRSGQGARLTTRDKHLRVCYVVAEDGADTDAIRTTIVTMPNYFADYDTEVHFIDAKTMAAEHQGMPHGGTVMRRGETAPGMQQLYEFGLQLSSNPEFTAAVNVACARAVHRAYTEGRRGCVTVFDLPLAYWSPVPAADLYKSIL